jgi:hypothetical protein|tara:strand:- start:782 stop:988 length:207 start_codon:yes stop_codon:yes gene_type:complete
MALKKKTKEIIKMSLGLREYERKQIVVALTLSMLNDISAHDAIHDAINFNSTDDLLRYIKDHPTWHEN